MSNRVSSSSHTNRCRGRSWPALPLPTHVRALSEDVDHVLHGTWQCEGARPSQCSPGAIGGATAGRFDTNRRGEFTVASTAPGWYADPAARHEYRYWDGAQWTEHVSDRGNRGMDPIRPASQPQAVQPQAVTSDTHATEHRPSVSVEPRPDQSAPEKITAFNAKRVASTLQAENQRLRGLLNELGAVDAAERQRRIGEQRALEQQLNDRVTDLRREVTDLEQQLIVVRDRLALEELGLFDFEHAAEESVTLSAELESLRAQIRQANKLGTAISASQNFTFNNSAAKGKTFVNQMSRIMLRSYNAEAENAVKTVKAGNLGAAQKRLETARTQIAKQGQMIDLQVTDHYHWLRSRELELAARHLQAVAAAKELERERRAELREQRQLEAEIRREKERLEKERAHYLNSIQRLREAGDEEAATALQAELDRIDAEIAQADYRAANIRAGYVYVISNIGAFGEGVVKIGMTRRLEPMDRIRELGDASVPFAFDVHALFFSDDAVSIEAMLHREFASERLNKVNPRREFFRVNAQQVLDALEQHNVSVLEFKMHPDAADFRMSWPEGYPIAQRPSQ